MFDDFDVVVGTQDARHAPDERHEEIDADAHIGGVDNCRMFRRALQLRFLLRVQAGRPDDMHHPRLCGQGRMGHGRLRVRKVEDRIAGGEQDGRIGIDPDA
jgi:hypothetical protein